MSDTRRRWVYVGMHPYVPAECSHPRARWFADVDRCVAPESTAEPIVEEVAVDA